VGTSLTRVSSWAEIKFLFDHPLRLSFPPPFLFAASAMGRRAKNKQGDPLPLHADPDLNGSSKASKPKSKPGHKAKFTASDSNAKLGKRKLERDDDDGRATKKPKGVRSAGKSRPQAMAASVQKPSAKAKGKPTKQNGKRIDLEEDEVMDDDGSVGWEDVGDVGIRAEARCVCMSEDMNASPNLRVAQRRSLFRDSDATDDDEDEDAEEFTGFTGDLEDLESEDNEAEEYAPLLSSLPRNF